MNVYSVRDRMIDYFLPPFLAPSDNEAIAAIAAAVNSEGDHALTKAPKDFEIWRLAYIEETGTVKGPPERLRNCLTLIRDSIREGGATGPGDRTREGQSGLSRERPTGDRGDPATPLKANGHAPPAAYQPPEKDAQRPERVPNELDI